jgi:hypothetical protein
MHARIGAALVAGASLFSGFFSSSAQACASCGCSLSSDWDSQGISTGPGLRLDLRYDTLNQDQVRSGTGKVSAWPVPGHEQELYTKNNYVTAGIDYSVSPLWGVTVQMPYVDRAHATNGLAFDGSDAGTSHTRSIGDVKVIGRYTGLTEAHDLGLQFGLKLPTGRFDETFSGGAIAGQTLDRGLQPGTGTTDAIVGVFRFAPLSQNWDVFGQALAQWALNSRQDYRPGQALNLNAGLRYMGFESWIPQLQLNARLAAKDSGLNASPDDSGGRLVYLSPGATLTVREGARIYAFVQVPVYQNLNGYQLAPRYTLTVGTRLDF